MAVIRSLGHSCFTLTGGAGTIVFDPYLSDNPDAVCGPDELQVDAILPSHGHDDHLGDTIPLARRLGCPVVSCFELCMYCARFGCEVAPMHIGGSRQFDFGRVKLTPATHGSAVVTAEHIEYTGPAVGFIVVMNEVTVYFAGDTGLFGDMKLIGSLYEIDAAILPIGDCFTMGPEDALLAAEMIRPKLVIPTHFNAFAEIKQDADTFAEELDKMGLGAAVLRPGDELKLGSGL